MEGHRDISDMSFEEFFSEPAGKPVVERTQPARPPVRKQSQEAKGRGFGGAVPKVNHKDGRFLLYIPRYDGGENDQFATAIECDSGIIPSVRLESIRRQGGRQTRTATLDLTELGVSPLDQFKLTIDGAEVYVNRRRDVMFFNNIGLPLGKPAGDVVIVSRAGTPLRMVKTEVVSSVEREGLSIVRAEVSLAGGVWIDDRRDVREEREPAAGSDAHEEDVPASEAPAEKPKAKSKKASSVKAKAVVSMPEGLRDAVVIVDGTELPLYSSEPEVSVEYAGCEPVECTVSVIDAAGEIVFGRVPGQNGPFQVRVGRATGRLELRVERAGKLLASSAFFLIPDFACSYSGKGDIPEDTAISFTMFGIDYAKDVFDEDLQGPYEHDGARFMVRWAVPAVTYDLGSGPVRVGRDSVDLSEFGDWFKVTARGARKKKLFFSGPSGKRRDLGDWDDDSFSVDMVPLRAEMHSVPGSEFRFFISVNSFPSREFLTVRNPPRYSAAVVDGAVRVEVTDPSADCRVRIHKRDKSVEEVRVGQGSTDVPVPADAVEAELAEVGQSGDLMVIPVRVRPLPFLAKDQTGDPWLYVSKSKRIPLPDNLSGEGMGDMQEVKRWYDRIVRMNPELREVKLQEMERAFREGYQ